MTALVSGRHPVSKVTTYEGLDSQSRFAQLTRASCDILSGCPRGDRLRVS
jgi:hypothetical protein